MPDPLSVRCRACLAEPGDPCIGTTSDLPRERPHLLRSLAGTPRLVRCEPCRGTGWEPTGRDMRPGQTGCPVCDAVPGAMCSEAGKVRGAGHRVRGRAAKAALRPCGVCDAVGWLPEPAPEGRPQDVPDELVALGVDAWHASGHVFMDRSVRAALAAVLPEHERQVRKAVFAEFFGTPEKIDQREREAATKTRDDTVDLCERARPGEHAQRVLEAAADQLDAMPATDGAALKGPYWYRDGWKQATGMLRDWADYPPALADRIARRDGQRGAGSEHE